MRSRDDHSKGHFGFVWLEGWLSADRPSRSIRKLADETDSAMLNTKLVLLLANHIGDLVVLRAALRAANRPPS
jgi:hypothetical protein